MRQCFSFRNFRRDTRGVALIEFVIVVPVLLLLFVGAMEMTRYLIAVMRVQKAAYVMTDVVTQYPPATSERRSGEITVSEVQNVLEQYELLVGGRDDQRQVIVTSIDQVGTGAPTVRWQQSGGGSLSQDVRSVVTQGGPCGGCGGVRGTRANFTGDYDVSGMRSRENIVIGEVFFRYEPLLNPLLANLGINFQTRTISRAQLMMPRNGSLNCLPESFVYASEC